LGITDTSIIIIIIIIIIRIIIIIIIIIQGGSNMTGTNCDVFTHKSVPVIFEPPCNISPLPSAKARPT
jgi:hypothetical protein